MKEGIISAQACLEANRAPLAVLSRLASALHRRSLLEGVKHGGRGEDGTNTQGRLHITMSSARRSVSLRLFGRVHTRGRDRWNVPYARFACRNPHSFADFPHVVSFRTYLLATSTVQQLADLYCEHLEPDGKSVGVAVSLVVPNPP